MVSEKLDRISGEGDSEYTDYEESETEQEKSEIFKEKFNRKSRMTRNLEKVDGIIQNMLDLELSHPEKKETQFSSETNIKKGKSLKPKFVVLNKQAEGIYKKLSSKFTKRSTSMLKRIWRKIMFMFIKHKSLV